MKIVLLGYMASGKSAVGRLLSEKLNLNFIDLDAYIEAQEGKSIATIFSEKGEIYFRQKESFYLAQLLEENNDFVLSLGGGTPCYGKNIALILKYSTSVYLKSSIKTIIDRVKLEKEHRPLIANIADENLQEFIAKHLFERAPYYEQAHQKVITDQLTINEVVEAISI